MSLAGQSLGRYHILEQLGEGGMATVYKAYDTQLEREVACKIIRSGAFPPDHLDRILKRFEREAKALAKLSHPNIVKVLDYGEHAGSPYLVLEYLPGRTLKQRLGGKAMPYQLAVKILEPIAHALDYAHGENIVHRDVKSSNILFTQDGEPMLSDFGVAKLFDLEETVELTGTGIGVGTPEYMAPEQFQGGAVDRRADIYSLGVVLYEMVTGRRPYQADTPAAIIWKQASEPLPRPSQFTSGLPKGVEQVLLKALAKRPQDRYQDMASFARALASLSPAEKVARSPKKTKPESPSKRARPAGFTIAGFSALGFLAVLAALWWGYNRLSSTDFQGDLPANPVPSTPLALSTSTLSPTPADTPTSTPFAYTPGPSPIAVDVEPEMALPYLFQAHDGAVNSVAFSPDGSIFASGSGDNTIRLWDTKSGELVHTLEGHVYVVTKVSFSPDGKLLSSASMDSTVRIWDLSNQDIVKILEMPAGRRINCVFSSDGTFLLLSSDIGGVTIINTINMELRRHFCPTKIGDRCNGGDSTIVLSKDGKLLAVPYYAYSAGWLVGMFRIEDGNILGTFESQDSVLTADFTPDGKKFVTAGHDGIIYIRDASTWTLEQMLIGHEGLIRTLTISPDGMLLASGSLDQTIRIWNLTNGVLLRTLMENTSAVTSVAFSPDGNTLASGYEDGTIGLWNVSAFR